MPSAPAISTGRSYAPDTERSIRSSRSRTSVGRSNRRAGNGGGEASSRVSTARRRVPALSLRQDSSRAGERPPTEQSRTSGHGVGRASRRSQLPPSPPVAASDGATKLRKSRGGGRGHRGASGKGLGGVDWGKPHQGLKVNPDDFVHYKEHHFLRGSRADLLNIKRKLNDFITTKYKSVKELFGILDCDGDGVVSMQDWLNGLERLNLPIPIDDAQRMFIAIDTDSSNGLDYPEVVNVLEPSSVTSFMQIPDEKWADIQGFTKFTPNQVRLMSHLPPREVALTGRDGGHDDEDSSDDETGPSAIAAPVMDADEAERLRQERRDKRAGDRHHMRMAKKGINPMVLWELQSKIEEKLEAQGGSPGMRFLKLFKMADRYGHGYITHKEFKRMLGPKGMNLPLSHDEIQTIEEAIADDTGAIEPNDFLTFLSTNFMPPVDAMDHARNRLMSALAKNVDAGGVTWRTSRSERSLMSSRSAPVIGTSAPPPTNRSSRDAMFDARSSTGSLPALQSSRRNAMLTARSGSTARTARSGKSRVTMSLPGTPSGNPTNKHMFDARGSPGALSPTARSVLLDKPRDKLAVRDPIVPDTSFGTTKRLLQPKARTAAFATESARFQGGAKDLAADDKAMLKRRLAGRAERMAAEKKWLVDVRQAAQNEIWEKERKRRAHRSAQQLNYMKKVVANTYNVSDSHAEKKHFVAESRMDNTGYHPGEDAASSAVA